MLLLLLGFCCCCCVVIALSYIKFHVLYQKQAEPLPFGTCKANTKPEDNRIYSKVTSLVKADTSDHYRIGKTVSSSSPSTVLTTESSCPHSFLFFFFSHMLQKKNNSCKMGERKRKTKLVEKYLLFTLLIRASLTRSRGFYFILFVNWLTVSI